MAQIKNIKLVESIAKQVKELRVERNITQEVFFFDTGIHIGRIEQGKNNISISTLNEICNYFKITLSYFFSRIEEKQIFQ